MNSRTLTSKHAHLKHSRFKGSGFTVQGYRATIGLIFLALNNNTIEEYGYDTAQICLNL